jgi:hypothetical protein
MTASDIAALLAYKSSRPIDPADRSLKGTLAHQNKVVRKRTLLQTRDIY